MTEPTNFSLRNNAKRAAERMINSGAAPSINYKLHTREDGRIEIVWQTGVTPAQADAIDVQIATERLAAIEAGEPVIPLAQLEQEIAEATIEADKRPDPEDTSEAEESPDRVDDCFGPDPWPPGSRVQVALSKRRARLGTVDYQVDPDHWRVFIDGAPKISNLYRGDQLSSPGADAPAPEPAKKERRVRTPTGRPSKSADLDAASARGVMPEKPIITSKANPGYQKRFDFLAERAAAADWEAVRNYEVKGINSYAKMVKQYRDRLLAAHAASTERSSEAA